MIVKTLLLHFIFLVYIKYKITAQRTVEHIYTSRALSVVPHRPGDVEVCPLGLVHELL